MKYILTIYRWNGTASRFRLEQEEEWFIRMYYPATQQEYNGRGLIVTTIPCETLAQAMRIIKQCGLYEKEVR